MKAIEMTNMMLSDECESVAASMEKYGGKGCGVKLREAAARLRKQPPMRFEMAFREDEEIIASLRAKLKVAEDALESAWMYASKLPHQWPLPVRVKAKMKNALAAIREEGDTK